MPACCWGASQEGMGTGSSLAAAGDVAGKGEKLPASWWPQPLLALWQRLLLLLPHVGDDVVLHNGDVGAVVPAHDRHAVGAHQELLKVPLDVVVPKRLPEEVLGVPKLLCHRGTGVLQEGEDLLLLGPVHIPFLEELEVGDKATTWPDILQSREDLRVLAGFLLSELVGREAQDDEPIGPQLVL